MGKGDLIKSLSRIRGIRVIRGPSGAGPSETEHRGRPRGPRSEGLNVRETVWVVPAAQAGGEAGDNEF